MTPLYEHDCMRCRFLGIDTPKPGEPKCNGVDMYVCKSILDQPLLLRRYSSEGSNYGAVPLTYASDRYASNIKAMEQLV